MKRVSILAFLAMLLFALSMVAAWSQGYTGGYRGIVTRENEPVPNLQVVFSSLTTGKPWKTKTEAKGEYLATGLIPDDYKVEVIAATGEILFTNERKHLGSNNIDTYDIYLDKPAISGGVAGSPGGSTVPAKKMTKEEIAKMKADNDKLMGLNTLVSQAQSAMQAGNWKDAEAALKQLLAAVPDSTRWEFYKALGDSQGRAGEYQDAIPTYEKGIQIANGFVAGTTPSDPKVPTSDPARAKAGIGQMLTSEGNAYFNLGDKDKAAEAFTKGAAMSANPGVAYYNLCAIQFNRGDGAAAVAACDKSIAADPRQSPNAYYIKGAVLYKNGKNENGKFVAPDGTAEALSKYLELAPSGEHAGEVKVMLHMMGKTP
ncbi:MAG TPA: tetratricopeptide repeat protein [Verrucomicrobiae bacterium]|jgi:tetratricopeptide (TPR) repeat protein|nr:tetratricopeptide repeat protein [Verrucomicrobiae bacterium]